MSVPSTETDPVTVRGGVPYEGGEAGDCSLG